MKLKVILKRFVKSLKSPDPSFPVLDYVSFSNNSTRSSTFTKLTPCHLSSSSSQHSYFNRLVRLWNFLPPIDISLSYPVLKAHLKRIFWTHFLTNFDSSLPCSLHIICPCCKCKSLPVKSTFHNWNHLITCTLQIIILTLFNGCHWILQHSFKTVILCLLSHYYLIIFFYLYLSLILFCKII